MLPPLILVQSQNVPVVSSYHVCFAFCQDCLLFCIPPQQLESQLQQLQTEADKAAAVAHTAMLASQEARKLQEAWEAAQVKMEEAWQGWAAAQARVEQMRDNQLQELETLKSEQVCCELVTRPLRHRQNLHWQLLL